jgi:hypothetical protein
MVNKRTSASRTTTCKTNFDRELNSVHMIRIQHWMNDTMW